ncbi:MAG TPA: DMT family transporter [Gemmatimonadales bacterium]|nr:DMT family transporter [Gemmatimonadales bacterium]
MPVRSRARWQLATAAALFSTGGAAIKAADFTGWQIAGLRSGIAAVAILLLAPAARRGWTARAILVGFAYAACLTLFVLANRLTTAANTIYLQSTAPLYLLVLSPWLLKEPIRRQDVGFMLAVGFGLALFFVSEEAPIATAPDPVRGNMLALISGFCWALTVCGLRWLGSGEGNRGSAVAAVVSGNITAFLVALPMARPLGAHAAVDWAVVIYLGVFQIAVAYVFVTSALKHIPALEASLILLIEPVLNPVWAWLFQGERPGPWAVLGGAVILGSTTFKGWLDARSQRVVAPPAEPAVAADASAGSGP